MKKIILLIPLFSLFLNCNNLFSQTAGAEFFLNILSPNYESIPSSEVGGAQFGGNVDDPVYGSLIIAGENDSLGCLPINEDLFQKIALIDRGGCFFDEKAINAEQAGALACIICNTVDEPVTMGAGNPDLIITIPTISLSSSKCDELKGYLNNGQNVELGLSPDPSPISRIVGTVADDQNGNCTYENGETTLADFKITADNGTFARSTYSDEDGNYILYLDTGNYIVNVFPPSTVWENCNPPVNVSLPEYELIETVDFSLTSLLDCPLLTVDVTSPIIRRCFDNFFIISYCNLGSQVAVDASATVTLDPLYTIVGSSLPYTEDNNTFTFTLGDVDYGTCSDFVIGATLSCDAELGQTICTVANIFPDDECSPPLPLWDGVDIFVDGNCNQDEVQFLIQNNGDDMTTPLSYRIIRNAEYLETNSFLLGAGETQSLMFPADGATYRVEADQTAFHPWENSPSATVEACSTDGEYETGFFTMFPVADYGDTYDELCMEVVGAYDPNDKQGFPRGYGDQHYIDQNVDLTYMIRFQNTGTDTAFTVKINDEISEHLDLNTFRAIASSHSYAVDIVDREIIFTFDNIMLPDSFVNEPASNGWLEYEISQNIDVPLETVIENTAAIYFDFNDPIITNTTMHTVGENYLPVSIIETLENNLTLRLFPNPVKSSESLFIEEITSENITYEIFRIDGQRVKTGMTNDGNVKLSDNINAGVYFLKITNKNGLIEFGKFIVI